MNCSLVGDACHGEVRSFQMGKNLNLKILQEMAETPGLLVAVVVGNPYNDPSH